MTKQDEWQTRAAKWICAALLAVGGYLLLRYATGAILPFLIAWGVAVLVYPLSVATAKKIHLPQKLCAVVYVVLLLVSLAALVFFGVTRLLAELEELLQRLGDENNELTLAIERAWDFLMSLVERISFLGGAEQDGTQIGEMISGLVRETLSRVGAMLGQTVGAWLGAAPAVIFGTVVTVMACFYLSADYGKIRDALIALLPPSGQARVTVFRERAGRALRGYGRAYLLLFCLTFAEVLVGLWLLRVPYAFLIALCVAAVDFLPLFGAGSVLLPWAAFVLIGGDYRLGLGLLILYGVIGIVRQIAEPHLLGGSLGLHPLLSLACIFIGWQVFGFFGMLAGPAVAVVLKEWLGNAKTA